MVKQELEKIIQKALKELSIEMGSISVPHSILSDHGDYATNVALIASKQEGKSPLQLAENIKKKIKEQNNPLLEKVEVAGPGFINFHLSLQGIEQHVQEVALEVGAGYQFKRAKK